jgi:hypothetical protein
MTTAVKSTRFAFHISTMDKPAKGREGKAESPMKDTRYEPSTDCSDSQSSEYEIELHTCKSTTK